MQQTQKDRGFSVSPRFRPQTAPVTPASVIAGARGVTDPPKVISWQPGVPRSSVALPANKPMPSSVVTPEPAPAPTGPPAPSARNKPSPRHLPSHPVQLLPSDLLQSTSRKRVVATDVLAIDRHEKYRLAGIVRVLSEYLNALAIGPNFQAEHSVPAEPDDSYARFSRFERTREAIIVKVCLPGGSDAEVRRFKLTGAMFAYGVLHHYRVVSGDGEMYLIPPDWVVSPLPLLVPADEGFLLGAGA
jgi:hypothetical protein